MRAVVFPDDDREDPVPGDDDEQAERAEEVDVPVPPGAPRRGGRRLVVVLAIANVMSNRVLPAWPYVPWNLLVAVAVVLIAAGE